MRHLVIILLLAMASTAHAQIINPGTITASLNEDCEIVVASTAPPDTAGLMECRYEVFFYAYHMGHMNIILGYAPCDADTMRFDLPDNMPNYLTQVRVLKRLRYNRNGADVWRRSNYAYIPAKCTVAPPPPPPVNWQDLNTVTPMGNVARVVAADAGFWMLHDAFGNQLGYGGIPIGQMDITIPPSNTLIYLTCYFNHNGEFQVVTLGFL